MLNLLGAPGPVSLRLRDLEIQNGGGVDHAGFDRILLWAFIPPTYSFRNHRV